MRSVEITLFQEKLTKYQLTLSKSPLFLIHILQENRKKLTLISS